MKNKIIILVTLVLFILLVLGCGTKQETKVNILATADLNSIVTNELISFVESEREKDENLILVDAGDFFDIQSEQMRVWQKANLS